MCAWDSSGIKRAWFLFLEHYSLCWPGSDSFTHNQKCPAHNWQGGRARSMSPAELLGQSNIISLHPCGGLGRVRILSSTVWRLFCCVWGFCFDSYFVTDIFTRVIVDSHAFVRSNSDPVYPLSCFPNGNNLQNYNKYHNPNIDIAVIQCPYSAFSGFICTHLLVCMCVVFIHGKAEGHTSSNPLCSLQARSTSPALTDLPSLLWWSGA